MRKFILIALALLQCFSVFAVHIGRLKDDSIYLLDNKFAAISNDSLLAAVKLSHRYMHQTNLLLLSCAVLLALILLFQIWTAFVKKQAVKPESKPNRPIKQEEAAPTPPKEPFKWEDK